nr:abscisic acid 8'-hydroxylase 4-like [Ipomoea batatas]
MGWPYIGETLQLYSQDPNIFFTNRESRYGEIFKTRILGYPCVMLASPEAARFVLVTAANLFKPTYPKSKESLIGPSALFFHQGSYHVRLRKMVQGALSPDSIRGRVADIEAIALSALDSWAASGQAVNTFQEMKKFSFEVGILAIFGCLEDHQKEELKKNYSIVNKGYNSFPTNFPTNEKGHTLNDDQIADNIIGVLFAAQDTTASVLTWILKYLHDNPKLLQAVKAEQKAIRLSKTVENSPLTWTDTRQMPTTYKVVLETLRMSSVISFTFREAVADVEYQGYLIPKGWKVLPLFRNIHHNPDFFTDPQKFEPSRFENAPKPNTFMPFGSGVHACPGNELAKLEMLVMTHHLVTKFRWEVVGSQKGIQYAPFPVPQNGLPARFLKESSI